MTSMRYFFSTTKRVTVDLDDDPLFFFAARLPFGTLRSVISRIWTM